MTDKIIPINASPVRRSGASNLAPAHLQDEFIGAARAAMGQPDAYDITKFLHKFVKLTFNGGDREPVAGVLLWLIDHPATGHKSTYLVLDHGGDDAERYALNSIQSIEEVDRPPELTEGT